jgi:hypothetical protein
MLINLAGLKPSIFGLQKRFAPSAANPTLSYMLKSSSSAGAVVSDGAGATDPEEVA